MTPVLDPAFNALTVYMASRLKWDAVDYDPYRTLAEMRADYMATGRIKVSTLHSENSIYGDPDVNVAGRAWHDYCHLAVNAEFDAEGERLAAAHQMAQLRTMLMEGKILYYRQYARFCDIIDAEVNGQVAYYLQHGSFPINGYNFTKGYLGL